MNNNSIVEITMGKFIEICREVYELGLSGSGDIMDSAIEDVMIKNGISLSDQWKIYKVKELLEMPVNSVFAHSLYGRCWISERLEKGVKYMSFSNRGPADFRSDSHPWDKPMKLVG